MAELEPCPFCGGEAEIKECFFTGFHKALFIAKCKNIGCGAIGSECVTKESAVNAWNRRSNWHTGTPTEEGDYLVAVSYFPMLGVDYQINRFLLEPYNGFIYQLAGEGGKIVAWQKIEPFKEKNNG